MPPIVRRHPSLRWLVPLAVVGVAGLAATGVFHAEAHTDSRLPKTNASALIAAMQQPHATGFSGTVVSRMSLGLPELPTLGAGSDGAQITSLLSGSHTLQVWYGGVDRQRVALLGTTDETDVFRSGQQVWQWSSADRVAVHAVLPKGRHTTPAAPIASLTPSAVASQAITRLDPTTKVTVRHGQRVADRTTYELDLVPRTAQTRVAAVHISVDGATKTPLGVQVYSRGGGSPAVDIAFTNIHFATPADSAFRFTPPSGAKVRRAHSHGHHNGDGMSSPSAAASRFTRTGSGWTTVYGYRTGAMLKLGHGDFAKALTPVSGSWGSGRLFTSDLVCALITKDGRVYAGAVDPDLLYAAAGRK